MSIERVDVAIVGAGPSGLENTRAQVALMRPDILTTALRGVVADVMNMDDGNRYFGEMMSSLTTRYGLGDKHSLVGRFCGNLTLPTAEGEIKLFSLMQCGNGLLVDAADGAALKLAGAWTPRVNGIRVTEGTSILVRPEGCVAWASNHEDIDGLESALQQWFGPPESHEKT